MKDKKGIVPLLLITIVGLVIAVVLISLFLFSKEMRLILGGVALVGLAIWGTLKFTENKKVKAMVLISMFVGGILLIFVFPNVSQTIFGGIDSNKVYVSESGTLYCEEDSLETITKWADQNYEFTCGDGYLVEECFVYLNCEGTPFYNRGCGGSGILGVLLGGDYTYLNEGDSGVLFKKLSPGEKIQFTDDIRNAQYLTIDYEFKPFNLWTEEFGKDVRISSNDCCLANQRELEKDQFEKGDWDCLTPNEKRNYFLGWTEVLGSKIYTYNNQDVMCLSNTLYDIDEVDLADGSSVNIQGDFIKYVECCPHIDDNCDSTTFTFVKEPQPVSCTYDYQCPNQGDPYISGDKAYQYECVFGTCKISQINVECTSSADCRALYGTNYACDLTFDNYGQCYKIGVNEEICDNGLDDDGDGLIDLNDDDCQNGECKWYQELKLVNEVDRKWYNLIGIGEPTIINSRQCKTASWVYLAGGGLIILILGSVAILTSPKKKKGKKKRR